jgi:hypothetical protein
LNSVVNPCKAHKQAVYEPQAKGSIPQYNSMIGTLALRGRQVWLLLQAPHLPAGVPRYAADAGQVCEAVGGQEDVQRDLPAAGLPRKALEEGVLRVAQLRLTLSVVQAEVVPAGLQLARAKAGQPSLEQQQLATQVAHH